MCIAIIFLLSKQGVFVVEQPRSSLLYRHPRFQTILRMVRATCLFTGIGLSWHEDVRAVLVSCVLIYLRNQVWKISFYMRALGAPTPKRTTLWANSQGLRGFSSCRPLTKDDIAACDSKLVRKTITKEGKAQYTGQPALKESQTGS